MSKTRKRILSLILGFVIGGIAAVSADTTRIPAQGVVYAVLLAATNAWTGVNSFIDANFSILDDGDPTKIAKFQLSGITTGTTRTYTLPNVSSTVGVLTGVNQIWTAGHTFSSNVAVTGKLAIGDGTTITVDGATTFAVTTSYHVLACTGAETINTITGGAGLTGMTLVLLSNDTDCTIADDDTATAANAVNLTGTATNDVGAVGKHLVLLFDGNAWQQIGESANN